MRVHVRVRVRVPIHRLAGPSRAGSPCDPDAGDPGKGQGHAEIHSSPDPGAVNPTPSPGIWVGTKSPPLMEVGS